MLGTNLTKICICVQISLLLGGCEVCEPPKEPCLPWVEMGETYEVEIVQHFELQSDRTNDPSMYPYGSYNLGEQTCGQGFDMEPGSIVEMTAAERQHKDNVPECAWCIHIRARASIGNVSKLSSYEGAFAYSLGQPYFADMFTAALDEHCQGQYWIGIMQVSSYFLENSGQYVATDHMLFREFFAEDDDTCRRPGSEISAVRGGCWDSWAVRVRDSSGRLITKDQPRPVESDAAISDAAVVDEDAELPPSDY